MRGVDHSKHPNLILGCPTTMILQKEEYLFSTSVKKAFVSNVLTLDLWQYNDSSIYTTMPVPPRLMGVPVVV